jgi:DNA polymerase elongation subunit (family B)
MRKFKIVKKPAAAAPTAKDENTQSFRLIDFNVYDCIPETNTHSSASDSGGGSSGGSGSDSCSVASDGSGGGGRNHRPTVDSNEFRIQMFGINEQGETCSIFVDDYHPFFYVKVADHWTNATKSAFIRNIKENLKSKYYENSIITEKCEIVEKRKLYGFDGGKNHKFVLLVFKNTTVMNRVKNLWYCDIFTPRDGKTRVLKPDGYIFEHANPTTKSKTKTNTYIYEANIPPVLRFFHIQKISPSGWVTFSTKKTRLIEKYTTT